MEERKNEEQTRRNEERRRSLRLSWLEFGDVGESLAELEMEYEDMMANFEEQKSRLHDFAPTEQTISEEGGNHLAVKPPARAVSPSPSNSSNNSSKKRHSGQMKRGFSSSGIHNPFSSIKRRWSLKGSASSSGRKKSADALKSAHLRSETSSIDMESEVFDSHSSVQDTNSNNSVGQANEFAVFFSSRHGSSASAPEEALHGTCVLESPRPLRKTPIPIEHNLALTDKDSLLSPPVLVDGELRKDFQYLSPVRQLHKDEEKKKINHIFHSAAKLLGKECERSTLRRGRKKEESPLKALYRATVLSQECGGFGKENIRVAVG